jgi:hypothetical protein
MISTKERLSPEEEFNKLMVALHKKVRKPGGLLIKISSQMSF